MPAETSRPLDMHRWSDYPELRNCLTELIQEIEAQEGRQRKRAGKDAQRLRDSVRCLVLDLYVAWKTSPDLEVAIPLGNTYYTKRTRYRALFIRYQSIKAAFRGLRDLGYLKVLRTGFNDRVTGVGRVTRIVATEKLIELLTGKARLTLPAIGGRVDGVETIILRDASKQKKLKEYDDTDETIAMRSALARINEHLQRHWVDLYITDAEFEKLQQRMQADYQKDEREEPFIDFTRRSLVRIFNNENWKEGGRFYRGWWQSVPKKYRRYVTINTKRTVEVDYSGLHPTLMYAEVGTALEGDAYRLPDRPDIPRDLVKTTFNKMVNAKGSVRKPPEFDSYGVGLSWMEFQQAIAERHKPIARFFNTGHGLRLQRRDADIAEQVMLRFLEMGYCCLPVHDSFLVHHGLDAELKQIMVKEFGLITGQTIPVTLTEGIEPARGTGLVSSDIEAILNRDDEYGGYNSRWEDWLKLQIAPERSALGPPSHHY